MQSDQEGRSSFDRVRALFDRAMELPAAEREAFVQRADGCSPAERERTLQLLRAGQGDTTEWRDAVDGDAPRQEAGDRVQSTATGELLDKLKTAPKLDDQRFVLEGELGEGGMGVVMKIHDRFLNRRLAMKVQLQRRAPRDEEEERLAHQLLGRFLEEAQVTSQLDHPGVVPVHELGLDASGKVWFTMRMVKGRTAGEVFADCFAQEGEWDVMRGLEVVLKVCDTMAYAHDKGVLHRDLKPQNVMVGRFGEVYVMDWGLAKVVGQQDRHDLRIKKEGTVSRIDSTRRRDAETDAQNSVVTMDGHALGTPSYMSPEQARSEEIDARADVYSIGAMLYELVTGRAPYTSPGVHVDAYKLLREVADGPPKRVEDLQKGVPAELVAIIDKAMSRDRERRYRDVMELASDVRAFVSHRAVKAYRTGAIVEMKLWVRRNKPLAASLAAAVLILLGAIGVTTWQSKENARVAAEKAAKVAEFDQLSLVVDYRRLLQEEPGLGTAYPYQADALSDWLRRARGLLGRKDELASVVASAADAAGEGASQGPSQAAAQFLRSSLTELIEQLPRLEALVPEMEQRQRWSVVVKDLTLAHPKARVTWDEARRAVAASPKYAGQDIPLRDRDVWGLVPIGENPQSGLWEFYDLRSAWDGQGDPQELAKLPIPAPDAHGRNMVTGETGIVWVLLPGGTLPPGTIDEGNEQKTSVRLGVRLDPYFLSKYEVTRGQWRRWTGDEPVTFGDDGDFSLPVAYVNWYACNDTLAKLGLVLPSELQWEYGIRGGTATTWWTGDDEKGIVAAENIGERKPLPVGSKTANPFGLFDMGGNLWEWCYDEYTDYGTERMGDGRRPDPKDGPLNRCYRGGYFYLGPDYARSGYRNDYDAPDRIGNLGVRPARTSRR